MKSEVIRREAAAAGCDDMVVLNTCAVTGEAVRQAKQMIRRVRREKPDTRIVVTGCAAQTETKTFAEMPEVDRVIGNEEKFDAAVWPSAEKIAVADIMAVKTMRPHAIDHIEGHTRAFVQVQNGCDHRCTFCIIPFGRGNSRSLPLDDVVVQTQRLVRERLSRDRPHRRRYHELWLRPVGLASTWRAGQADPQESA